jgi:hypothetical protein
MAPNYVPDNSYWDCAEYDKRYRNAKRNGGPPLGPPPEGYREYLIHEGTLITEGNQGKKKSKDDNYVRMPADTLAIIVNAIGQNKAQPHSNHPIHPPPRFHQPRFQGATPKPFYNKRYNPPAPKNRNDNWKGKPHVNRRAKRNSQTKDPRRRPNATDRPGTSGNIDNPIPIPIHPVIELPDINETDVNDINIHADPDDISFLNEFANADIGNFSGDDVMGSEILIENIDTIV